MSSDCNHYWVYPSQGDESFEKRCQHCDDVQTYFNGSVADEWTKSQKVNWTKHRLTAQKKRHGK